MLRILLFGFTLSGLRARPGDVTPEPQTAQIAELCGVRGLQSLLKHRLHNLRQSPPEAQDQGH